MRTRTKRNSWRRSAGSESGGGVNLISMMDVLTVLLLFLLKSYVSGGEVMVPPAGVQLPASTAKAMPQASLVVAIDGDEIVVGSERVASIPEIERHIKDAGFVPQRRNMMYEPVDTPATDKFGNPAGQKKVIVSKVEA